MSDYNSNEQTPPPKPTPSGPRVVIENFDINDLIKHDEKK